MPAQGEVPVAGSPRTAAERSAVSISSAIDALRLAGATIPVSVVRVTCRELDHSPVEPAVIGIGGTLADIAEMATSGRDHQLDRLWPGRSLLRNMSTGTSGSSAVVTIVVGSRIAPICD